MSSKSLAATALVTVTLLFCRTLDAQILYGGLVGNITDQSGGAVPEAKVTIKHIATGTTRETATNDAGTYRFPTIAPGTYSVRVQADGFRAFNQSGIDVTANSLTRIDTRLEVGAVTEQVTVEGSAVALQTDRAEVRHELNSASLENVPIPIGRNYQMLLGTLPGFTPPQNAHSVPANGSRQSDPLGPVFGQRHQ
jgi:hypothetical protein